MSARPRSRDLLPARRRPRGPVLVGGPVAARVAPPWVGARIASNPVEGPRTARYLPLWAAPTAAGAVVAVDVLRAFTTAAYAFAAGVSTIVLAETVEATLAYKAGHPGVLAAGEVGGRRPEGFDLPNSPALVAAAGEAGDLRGRELVLRTSAGTRGAALAAASAERLWCASLVVASATARAVAASGLGAPVYVITGRFPDAPLDTGGDDLLTAELIDLVRAGGDPAEGAAADAARALRASEEAARTLALGPPHVHPDDVVLAARVDAFDFAMEATRLDGLLQLRTARGGH